VLGQVSPLQQQWWAVLTFGYSEPAGKGMKAQSSRSISVFFELHYKYFKIYHKIIKNVI
jgi:hypothetical protein